MTEAIFRNNRILYSQQGRMKKIGSLIEEIEYMLRNWPLRAEQMRMLPKSP
jgi:hypothetical protein